MIALPAMNVMRLADALPESAVWRCRKRRAAPFDRHAECLGGHLRNHRMRALPDVRARVTYDHFLDLGCAAQLDLGRALFRRAEAEKPTFLKPQAKPMP